MNFYRKAYSFVGTLLLLEYVLQFFFIGAAIFSFVAANVANNAQGNFAAFHSGDLYYNLHILNGVFAITLTTLLLFAFSFGAQYPDRTTKLTGLLVLLSILQDFLTGGIPFVPAPGLLLQFPAVIAGLHSVNGVIMLTLAVWLVYNHWVFGARGKMAMQSSPANPKP